MNDRLNILLIEDNPGDARLIRELLITTGDVRFQLQTADRLAKGLERLAAETFDLALLDLSLPDSQGLETFVQVHLHAPDVPIIVLTGLDDEMLAMAAMRQGAQDYLVKGQVDGNLLARAIRYAIERDQTQQALRKWANVFEHAEWGIVVSSTDGLQLEMMNPAFARMHGYTVEELAGRPVTALIAPEERGRFTERVGIAGESGHYTFESVRLRKDGTTFPALVDVTAVRDEAGRVLYRIVNTQDITERKQAEEALAQERNLLRTLIDNLPDYVWVKDTESRIVVGNIAIARSFGKTSPEAIQGMTDFDYHAPELAAQFRVDEQAVLRSGQPLLNREECVIEPDGSRKWLMTTKAPLRDRQGNVVGLVGINRDITRLKQAEDTLRRSADRLALLHAIDQATLALQPLAAITETALRGLRELASCSRADVALLDPATGAFVVQAICAEDAARLGAGARFALATPILARLQQGKAQVSADLQALPDLPPVLQSLQAEGWRAFVDVPMRVEGTLIGLLHLVADHPAAFTAEDVEVAQEIADQLAIAIQQARLREQVARHTAELEQRVAERTAELTQREAALRAANDKLKELDRFKSGFVSDVSHELRQPLTNLKSYLYLLDHGKPEKRAGYMATLHREADLLQQLIEDLLHLSRMDLGKVKPALAPVDLTWLVGTLVADRAPLAAEHGLALHTVLAADLPPALADAKMVTQVLTNLLANAMNYTPAGGAITVRTGMLNAEGGMLNAEQSGAAGIPHSAFYIPHWITFSVSDTGPGIAAEEQARIFERFYRGEAARQSHAPGTGLGLPICQELVELHGGKITLASQVGQGSTFTVWLPAANSESAHTEHP